MNRRRRMTANVFVINTQYITETKLLTAMAIVCPHSLEPASDMTVLFTIS